VVFNVGHISALTVPLARPYPVVHRRLKACRPACSLPECKPACRKPARVQPHARVGADEGMPAPEALADPQLVDEHGEVGVELVVADTCGMHDQGARVVDRHPGRLADDLLVDVRPE
jgi:hypothetical protein